MDDIKPVATVTGVTGSQILGVYGIGVMWFGDAPEIGQFLYPTSAIYALQAEVERLRKDAERYRRLSGQAFKETAWDRFGEGAYWHIGFYAYDSRLSLNEAVDEMKGYG